MRINQIDLIAAIGAHIQKRHKQAECTQRQMNAIIKAATDICEAFERDDVRAKPGMGLKAWLCSDDTGLSSRFMADCLTGHRAGQDAHYPHDPDDFGRCFRLLEAAPTLRKDIGVLAGTCRQWRALIENWTELEALWLEESPSGHAPKLFDRMQALIK